MAIIKIPSSNIYAPPQQINTNNILEYAEISANKTLNKYGEIASVDIVPYEKDGTDFAWVGNYEDVNETADLWSFIIDGDNAYIRNYDPISKEIKPLKFDVKNSSLYWKTAGQMKLTNTKQYTTKSDAESQNSTDYTGKLRYDYDLQGLVFYDTSNPRIDPSVGTDYGDLYPYLFRANQKSGDKYLTLMRLTVSGEYIDEESKNQSYSVNENTENKISLQSNELVQRGCTYTVSESSHPLYIPRMLRQVVEKHQNGKEVYTIKCSVGNYYDTSSKLAICPTNTDYPTTFKKYDIVRPYVFTSEGEIPLSTKADGTPKDFEIIGIDYSYKGVFWQELTIQENT